MALILGSGNTSDTVYIVHPVASGSNATLAGAKVKGTIKDMWSVGLQAQPSKTFDDITLSCKYNQPNLNVYISGFTGKVYVESATGPVVKQTISDPTVTTTLVFNITTESTLLCLIPD